MKALNETVLPYKHWSVQAGYYKHILLLKLIKEETNSKKVIEFWRML